MQGMKMSGAGLETSEECQQLRGRRMIQNIVNPEIFLDIFR